jgi:hypothetical protein
MSKAPDSIRAIQIAIGVAVCIGWILGLFWLKDYAADAFYHFHF